MNVFQMSLSSGFLIVAVVIVRSLTLHWLPKKTFLALWGIVLCRMFLPFSIPSRFSFFTGVSRLYQMVSQPQTAQGTTVLAVGTVSGEGNAAAAGGSVGFSPVMLIWLTGLCVFVLLFVTIYLKDRVVFQTSFPEENPAARQWVWEHPMKRKVQMMQNDSIQAPLTYGIFHPVVLLPPTVRKSDKSELDYVFAHEYVHIRRFDNLTKLLLALALCIYWFHPLVWVMYVLANRDLELSCDETVVRELGTDRKSSYAMMLIDMEEKKCGAAPLCSHFSKNAIEERILCIMKIKKTSLVSTLFALMLVAGTAGLFGTSASAAAETESPATLSAVSSIAETKAQDGLNINQTAISYKDYQAWLAQYKVMIHQMVQDGKLSQENADKSIAEHENVLTDIQNGDQVSLYFDGSEEKLTVIPQSEYQITESSDSDGDSTASIKLIPGLSK